MAKTPIRKTIEHLIKKVEALEDQSFGQKLIIDELEEKLFRAEETIKQVKENPFNLPTVNIPFIQSPSPFPPITQPQWIPPSPLQIPLGHICTPGQPTWTGAITCTSCGMHLSGPIWTVTTTSDSTQICLEDTNPSSTDVEPVLDLDISWAIPDDLLKKD